MAARGPAGRRRDADGHAGRHRGARRHRHGRRHGRRSGHLGGRCGAPRSRGEGPRHHRRRHQGGSHLGLDQPGRWRRGDQQVDRRSPCLGHDPRRRRGRVRRGAGDGRDHLRRRARDHRHVLLHRHHQLGRQGREHRQPGPAGRQGHRRRHLLHRRPVVPGRCRRAGRGRREGRRRHLPGLGRKPGQAELRGNAHRREPRLRPGRGHGQRPDAGHVHQPGAVHLAAVGRAVGRGHHRPRARRLRRRRALGTANTNNITTGLPRELASFNSWARTPLASGSGGSPGPGPRS